MRYVLTQKYPGSPRIGTLVTLGMDTYMDESGKEYVRTLIEGEPLFWRDAEKILSFTHPNYGTASKQLDGTFSMRHSTLGDFSGDSLETMLTMINDGWAIDPAPERKLLFVSEEGIKVYEGESWWYVVLDSPNKNPRKTNVYEYKGKNHSDQVKAFYHEANAKREVMKLLPEARLLSLTDIHNNIGHLSNLEELAKERFFA